MPISNSTELFNLIHSLNTSEKRNFKLYAGRNFNANKLSFVTLFDIIDQLDQYDEKIILSKIPNLSKSKLSNLKRHLYSQILNSLRVLQVSKRPNIELRAMIDNAYILYEKGFYMEALKVLEKAKKAAAKFHLHFMHATIIEFEKKIESRHITRNGKAKAQALIQESIFVNTKMSLSNKLSNLRTFLHGRYIEYGHCRTTVEKQQLIEYFREATAKVDQTNLDPMSYILLLQSYVWYHYILIDFKACLSYAETWVAHMETNSELIERDVDLYLRGYHYVLSSCFHLRFNEKLLAYLNKIEEFRKTNYKKFSKLTQIISFQYVHSARLNKLIINGEFNSINEVISKSLIRIKRYKKHLDEHRVMIFYFKFAWLYFGNGNYAKCMYYLNRIVNNELPKLRDDIQIYARILFLMCHYELGNYDIFNYSIQTFEAFFKKQNFKYALQEITQQTFIKLASNPYHAHKKIMNIAWNELKNIAHDPFQSVSFTYLDVASWLESKVMNKSLAEVIQQLE